MCPFSVFVQHPSWDGDEGNSRWVSRWTTNWRANDHEPSLRWWHHPVGNFGGRTTGVGASSRLSQPQIQPTHQYRQYQGNGERQHSVSHTHSEWTTGTGEYVPIPWVSDYRRWWVYDRIPYQVKQRAGNRGITAENMEKSQHTDFNEGKTNESANSTLPSNILRGSIPKTYGLYTAGYRRSTDATL